MEEVFARCVMRDFDRFWLLDRYFFLFDVFQQKLGSLFDFIRLKRIIIDTEHYFVFFSKLKRKVDKSCKWFL